MSMNKWIYSDMIFTLILIILVNLCPSVIIILTITHYIYLILTTSLIIYLGYEIATFVSTMRPSLSNIFCLLTPSGNGY